MCIRDRGGIFPTIGAGAHAAGPAVILAYVLSGLVSLCVALCYAEFASMVPVAGSAYTYAYATLGELVAWVIGWDLILEYGLSLAPTASSLSDYFQHMLANVGIAFPAWAQTANVHGIHPQIDLFACLVTLGIALLVASGIRESTGVNGALVLVQIASMQMCIRDRRMRARVRRPRRDAHLSGDRHSRTHRAPAERLDPVASGRG